MKGMLRFALSLIGFYILAVIVFLIGRLYEALVRFILRHPN